MTPNPHDQDGPTVEERVRLQTVNHKVRTALVAALVIGAIAFATFMAAFR